MKIRIYLTLFFLSFFCNVNAQNGFIESEKYNCYEQHIYIDCLEQKLVPEIFNNTYYTKIKESELYVDSQIIDTIHQKRIICIYTKKARDGYLFVNEMIMDKVDDLNWNLDKLRIIYIYNDKIVSTSDEVKRVIGLKMKNIQNSVILQDEKTNIISVYIYDD
ncbi:hypothetical protein GPL06_20915 [Bacteroides salyersiae]|uniref:hypothetical protein n=1 Tax=Bacteroides salyersiae TaxID=291644 RepID=UPI001C01DF8A|nr:hypothetical protein [Bacteroides salyersiae]MBT9875213.1 hypothetical protein [Bacteroides salyersiae]